MELSAEAKTLLQSLRANPDFREILDALNTGKLPLYKPVRGPETLNVEAQEANWHFESGKLRERSRIIKTLLGENDE